MKKLLCLLLALVMVLAFAACDNDRRDRYDDDDEEIFYSSDSPEEAYDLWFTCMTTIASEEEVRATAPDEVWEYAEEDNDDVYGTYRETREDALEDWEDYYGDNFVVSYRIIDQEDLDADELEDYAEMLQEQYDIDPDDVEAGVRFYVEITMSGDDEEETFEDNDVLLKINGAWYHVGSFY